MDQRAPSAKPTLRTISELTGLAVPTVSRALHDAPDIGAKTKALVRRTAEEIGYVPNRAGVRLRTGKTNVISLVLSTEHDSMHYTKLISALAAGLRTTPYHLIVTPFFPDEDPMNPVQHIIDTGLADGIVINQTTPRDPRVRLMLDRGFPFATHGRTDWADEHAYYDYDNTAFAQIAMQRMAQNGRRKVLMVAPPRPFSFSAHMSEGGASEAERLGIAFRVVQRVTSDSPPEEIREKVAEILREEPDVDGIVCGSTPAAMACVGAIEARGLVVGRDVDLFSKEALPFLRYFRDGIIAMYEDVSRAGDFLAKAAMQAIDDPKKPPMQALEVPTVDSISD